MVFTCHRIYYFIAYFVHTIHSLAPLVRIPVSIENLSPKRQGIRCKSDVGSTSKLSTTLFRHPAAGRKRTEPETRSSTHGITTRTRFAQLELALHSTWLVGKEQAQVVDDGRMRAITFSLACQHLRMWARSPPPQVELEAQRESERPNAAYHIIPSLFIQQLSVNPKGGLLFILLLYG